MKKLMAANWKMYKTQAEAGETFAALVEAVGPVPNDREVLVFPPFTAINACAGKAGSGFFVGGQNCHPAKEGAYTGEISSGMLVEAGCTHVLVGHSERRALFLESDSFLAEKVVASLGVGLKVVFCVGETLEEREEGNLAHVLNRQLAALPSSVPDVAENLAVAYEPVWAIGTGKVAGPPEIVQAHALIRSVLEKKYGANGTQVRILYGGSVKPENAAEIIKLDNVDGVLVGGASLQAASFSRIVLA